MTLDELKRLEAAADPYPWMAGNGFAYDGEDNYLTGASAEAGRGQANADLIVAMRSCLPALIAVAEAAERMYTGDFGADDAVLEALMALRAVKP